MNFLLRSGKQKNPKNLPELMTSLAITKPDFSQCCHMHMEFQDTFKQHDGDWNSCRVCCSRQFPGTWTRVRGEAVIRQGLTASSELTLPGDAKEAQQNQAELSHGARCSPLRGISKPEPSRYI